jgi:hypothetical protein
MTLPAQELLYPGIAHLLADRGDYCGCADPSWEIEPEDGRCRACGLAVHPRDVRRMQALAESQIAQHDKKVRP